MPSRNRVDRRSAKADHRARNTAPMPPIEEIEQELHAVLTPAAFAPLRMVAGDTILRDRKLTLPVMTAVVLSMVLRRSPSLAELLRLLEAEGLLWVSPLSVSQTALEKRFKVLPPQLLAGLLADVLSHYQQPEQRGQRHASLAPWQQQIDSHFSAVWTADNSTLEMLRRKTKALKATESPTQRLGGMIFTIVESFTGMPLRVDYRSDINTDELAFAETLLAQLPEGGLACFDEGFFQFKFFDLFTDQGKFFLTRMRKQVRYRVVETLSENDLYRDEIIECGFYRSSPIRHRLRLVSVCWQGQWYQYLSNVLDPDRLPAPLLSRLYRLRWRIETAFAQVKRLLDMAYLWSGSGNAVEMQVYATWIIYAVIAHLCCGVAARLACSIEQISFEMIFRSLYHYSRARAAGRADDIISYMVENARMLGIVKKERSRDRLKRDLELDIWGTPP